MTAKEIRMRMRMKHLVDLIHERIDKLQLLEQQKRGVERDMHQAM